MLIKAILMQGKQMSSNENKQLQEYLNNNRICLHNIVTAIYLLIIKVKINHRFTLRIMLLKRLIKVPKYIQSMRV